MIADLVALATASSNRERRTVILTRGILLVELLAEIWCRAGRSRSRC